MTTHRRHVDMLHELMDSDPIEGPDQTSYQGHGEDTKDTEGAGVAHADEDLDISDDLLDQALAQTNLTALSREAQAGVLALTPESAPLEPATWQRVLNAANRGIQHHRNDNAALPRMLFVRRCEQELSLDEVARASGVPAQHLDAVEHGRERVETLTAAKVASWISVLGVGAVQARASLGRALELQRREDVALAAAAVAESKAADDKFIDDVIALLDTEADHH